MINKPISRDEIESRVFVYVLEAIAGGILTAVLLVNLVRHACSAV